MNNYILINRTYSQVTPESAECGEFFDTGFNAQNEQVSFSELVAMINKTRGEFPYPSQSPNNGGTEVWYSSGFNVIDYGDGTEEEDCIHFSSDNTINAAKYWRWAAIAAGHK